MNQPENKSTKFFIILVTTLASFMTAFMGSAINVALPIIGKEFKADAILLSWLSTSYLVTTAVLLIPVGKLSDIYGRARFFKAGIVIFAVFSLLTGFSGSAPMLLIFRAFQGVGSSMIFSTSTAILVSAFDPNERGKVIGINIASVYTGLSSGPFLGGLITHYLNWRYIFYSTSVIGAASLILMLIKIKDEWKEEVKEKFDIMGSLIFVFTLTILMVGFTFLPAIYGFILLITGAIGLFIFLRLEDKRPYPMLNINIFRSSRTYTFSNIAALINYSATFALTFLLSLYLQNVKMLSPQDTGIILVTQPVMMALFSPFAGRISDKIEPRRVASIGMMLLTIGLIVFIFLTPDTEYFLIVINLAVLGLGFALFSSPNTNAIMSAVERKYYGIASSTLALMRLIGQMFSMGIVIVIFSILIGKVEISPENRESFLHSMKIAFILFSILSFGGIFASLARGKIHKEL
ncbi:MAG: MFS transporter [Ignavibacteria bacterium]